MSLISSLSQSGSYSTCANHGHNIRPADFQGLGSMEKRLDVLNYLKEKNVIFIVSKTHTLPNHQNVFSGPSGIMNASSVQAHLTLAVWLFVLARTLILRYITIFLTQKEITLYVIYQSRIISLLL